MAPARTSRSFVIRMVALLLYAFGCVARAEPRKKLIATGWDQPDPDHLVAHWREMDATPFNGVVINIPGMPAAFSSQPWKPDAFDDTAVKIRSCQFRRLTDNFILFGANPGDVDWFDDAGWLQIVDHWRLAARVARRSGCKGIVFDPEPYTQPHKPFDYAAQTGGDRHTLAEYQAKSRQRGREVMAAVAGEFPDITILCYFLTSQTALASRGDDPQACLASSDYNLLPAFLDGWLDAAPPGVTLVDGCETAYRYNSPIEYQAAAVQIHGDGQRLVSPENRAKYRAKVQAGFGVYLDAYVNPPTSPWYIDPKGGQRVDRFRGNLVMALQTTDQYVWVYGEQYRWWPTDHPRVAAKSWEQALPGVTAALSYAADPIACATRQLAERRPPNLVSNGTFATDKDWTTWQAEGSHGAFGFERQLGSDDTAAARAAGVSDGCFIQPIPVKPGQRYAVRAKAWGTGQAGFFLRLRWKSGDGKWTTEAQDVLVGGGANAGERITLFGVADVPEAAGQLVVLLCVRGQRSEKDVAWFDDVEVYRLE